MSYGDTCVECGADLRDFGANALEDVLFAAVQLQGPRSTAIFRRSGGERQRSRDYYARNREAVLARAAARRGPRPELRCSECAELLEGRQRVTCGSSRCRDRRYARLHPESYAKREAAKVVRRRAKRRGES